MCSLSQLSATDTCMYQARTRPSGLYLVAYAVAQPAISYPHLYVTSTCTPSVLYLVGYVLVYPDLYVTSTCAPSVLYLVGYVLV